MFDATTLGNVGLIFQASGVLSSAVGSFYSAEANKLSLNTQAAIQQTNSRIAELGAQSALAAGQRQVGALTMKAGNLKSSQRAAMAANGIDLGEGNAAEIQASTDVMKETDALTISANALQDAWARRMQAVNASNDALMKSAQADSINPASSAYSSLLGGAGKVASAWSAMRSQSSTPASKNMVGNFPVGNPVA